MTTPVDAKVIEQLRAQAEQDPGLPRANPTPAFWQTPPHGSLSDARSETLPRRADYAIIGSGVTGCSVARTLLEGAPEGEQPEGEPFVVAVAVLEARALASGATGRNGGLLSSFVPGDYELLAERFGHAQAVKIARFANRTLERMHQLAGSSEELRRASDIRRTCDVVCLQDEEAWQGARRSWESYADKVPEESGKAEFLTPEEAKEVRHSMAARPKTRPSLPSAHAHAHEAMALTPGPQRYNVNAKCGAMVLPNGAFWPYRLLTGLWEQLLGRFGSRLTVDTGTPVTEISHCASTDPRYPYLVHTPRGVVRARKIIHATNGYAGHLLPRLRGKIYPLRGTMSVQKAPPLLGNRGRTQTWSVAGGGGYDERSEVVELGLYYASQNPRTGDVLVGGEKAHVAELIGADDTRVGAAAGDNLSAIKPSIGQRCFRDAVGEVPAYLTQDTCPCGEDVWGCLPACLLACLPACLLACLPACLLAGRELAGRKLAESGMMPAVFVLVVEVAEGRGRGGV
ncbi:hypothetical protein UVI_02019650 [Ustilaginoidea virens]|uniref:FAD dependent oxidoreductase domain-containing protein n=1 Tax=Ustilaginoidea virens TaxID=1159556 RepID=A0A1B5KZP3_USTVR|nr:hypothetical protein UVI_02019650 [Ustilaginoidea virens]